MNRPRHPSTPQAAFSLIELLLVIGIIALLVAMLMPALGRMRSRAKEISCMNNLRQVFLAARMYADENGGKLPKIEPMPSIPADPGNPLESMAQALGAQLSQQTAVLRCPQDQNGRFDREGTSYEWNATLNDKALDNITYGPIVVSPSVVILCWDFDNVHPGKKSGEGLGKNYLYADGRIAVE